MDYIAYGRKRNTAGMEDTFLAFGDDLKKNEHAGRPTVSRTMETPSESKAAGIAVATPEPLESKQLMLVEERRLLILNRLKERGRVKVGELSAEFGISEVTIRNDLKELDQRGLLKRSHGGAISAPNPILESNLRERLEKFADQKRRIGLAAASMVHDGETIILDSGTTTQEIAKNLRSKSGLQIITNGVNVAMELLGVRGIQLVVVGGTLRDDSLSLVGHFAESMLEQFSADKLFLGAVACDLHFGICTPNMAEGRVNQAMVRIAREKILVADSSKFLRRSLCRIVMLSEMDKIITDTGLPEHVQQEIRSLGPELILV
jgi:DeoR family transcriptional regulator of aga operon